MQMLILSAVSFVRDAGATDDLISSKRREGEREREGRGERERDLSQRMFDPGHGNRFSNVGDE